MTKLFIVDTKDTPPCSNPYSGISVKVVAVVGSLLKSYWNPDLPSFNSVELWRGTSQDHPSTITVVMPGSEHNQQPSSLSESPGQDAPDVLPRPIGFFAGHLPSDSGGNNGVPEQHPHTLGLNCFVHPCRGACQFRQSYGSSDSRAPDCEESSTDPIVAMPGQSSCPHLANRYCSICKPVNGVAIDSIIVGTIDKNVPAGQVICNLIIFGEDGQPLQCGKVFKDAKSLSCHKRIYHTGQKTCDLTVVGEDGQLQPCGTICKSVNALWYHKSRDHTGQQTCDVLVIGRDGLQRPCGTVSRNAAALTAHKSGQHTGQKTCDMTVFRKDGQPQTCGKVCKNAQALSNHKKRKHTDKWQQTCYINVIGEDGQPRPCRKIFKNANSLSSHRRGYHSGYQTCEVTVIGEDGRPRSCGKICKNANNLSAHKSGYHTGQQTCDMTLIGEDSQPRPCGKIFKNAQYLANHKIGCHTGQQTCDAILVGEDGQPRSCRKVCKSTLALSHHKRTHRKRKSLAVDQNDNLRP